VKVGKVPIDVLVDSGSAHSLMSERVARILKLKITPVKNETKPQLFSATGTQIRIVGRADVDMYIQGLRVTQTAVVAEELQPRFLLVMDFLSANVAVVSFKTGVLSLVDDLIHIKMHSICNDMNCVTLSRRTCAQPFSEMLLQVNTLKKVNNQSILLENLPHRLPVAIRKALAFCKNNKTVCRILNYNPYVVTLRKGLKLATIAGFDTIAAVQPVDNDNTDAQSVPACESDMYVSKSELDQFHESYGFHLGPTLTEDMSYDVLKMLYRYRTVFARYVSEIKLPKGPPLKIDLHTNRKLYKRHYSA